LGEKGKQCTNGEVAVFLTNFFALPEGGEEENGIA